MIHSMQVQQHVALKQFNTFGMDVRAKYFTAFTSDEELHEFFLAHPEVKNGTTPWLVLGGGSNILFTHDVDGWVLKNNIRQVELIKEDRHYVYVKAGAGENWHQFVMYCLQRNWAGVENLAMIPGNVGASPMQNIGAYGVEMREVFEELEAYHVQEGKIYTFSANDCAFGYRDSIFKNTYKGQFIILSVTFRLNKKPKFVIGYGAVAQELENMGVQTLSIKAVAQAVMNIRSSKLPDPAVTGNAGSFFKNPQVTQSRFRELQQQYPDIVGYPVDETTVKLAAGWMIERCGWKAFRRGDAGCHPKQALVLVNYGNATGQEIYDLSEEILKSVQSAFGILLEREVNII